MSKDINNTRIFSQIAHLDFERCLKPDSIKKRIIDVNDKLPENIQLIEMQPVDLKPLVINYYSVQTLFGATFLASTNKGICYAGFPNNAAPEPLNDLKRRFPDASFQNKTDEFQHRALTVFNQPQLTGFTLSFHLKGTPFQLSIWRKLLNIPFGSLCTYTQLGGATNMARAAGTAVGSNPVSLLIPCHRAVRSDGSFDRYFWGPELKKKLLTFEAIATTD